MRYVLGGKAFVPIGASTVEHDLEYQRMVLRVGFDRVGILEGELEADYALRLYDQVVRSGCALPLIGVLMIPEGVAPEAWTPELGRETSEHVARVTDPAEKAQVNAIILQLVTDFFERGLRFSKTFPTSSSLAQPDPTTSPRADGGPGPGSSVKWPKVILTVLARFCAGLLRKRFMRFGGG